LWEKKRTAFLSIAAIAEKKQQNC